MVAQGLEQRDEEGVARVRRKRPGRPVDRSAQAAAQARSVPRLDELGGEPAQVFQQGEAEHGGDRPEFADGQRRDGLVGADEVDHLILVEAAVGVGDHGKGQGVDARQSGERAVRQGGQLGVVAARQIDADLAQDLLDDVKIVEQPLRVGSERLLPGGGGDDVAVGGAKDAAVVVLAAQQRLAGRATTDDGGGGQPPRQFAELRGAAQLDANGSVAMPVQDGRTRQIGNLGRIGGRRGQGGGRHRVLLLVERPSGRIWPSTHASSASCSYGEQL